jgi:hypothetical protein
MNEPPASARRPDLGLERSTLVVAEGGFEPPTKGL